ncbi:MAG: RtcB family protein, partial [Actinobacteria bacterium]|nr:RtcB family protein [Actinomycetota bacterium]
LFNKGIIVIAGSMSGLAEEAPQAYKDVTRVVDVTHYAGISKKAVRLRPLGVLKG